MLWNRFKQLKQEGSKVKMVYPAKLIVGRRVIEDAFPGWQEALQGARIEPFESNSVNMCNTAAKHQNETRETSQQNHQRAQQTEQNDDEIFWQGHRFWNEDQQDTQTSMNEQTYSKKPSTERIPIRRSRSERNRDLQSKETPNLQKQRQKEQTLIHESKQVSSQDKTSSEMCKVRKIVPKDPKEKPNEQVDRQGETNKSAGPKEDISKKSQPN